MKTNVVLLGGLALTALAFWASRQRHTLQTEVELQASPQRVWEVLTDTAAYPEWNPVITRLEGELQPGQTIEFENHSGGRRMVFHPVILRAIPARELRWLGHLWLPHLFDGTHFFLLDRTATGGTRLRHGEHFRGILVPFVRGWLNSSVRQGFEQINAALNTRAGATPGPR